MVSVALPPVTADETNIAVAASPPVRFSSPQNFAAVHPSGIAPLLEFSFLVSDTSACNVTQLFGAQATYRLLWVVHIQTWTLAVHTFDICLGSVRAHRHRAHRALAMSHNSLVLKPRTSGSGLCRYTYGH